MGWATVFNRTVGAVMCAVLTFAIPSAFADHDDQKHSISIIIDDLGYRLHEDLRAIALPGPVAYAIMPHAPYSEKLAHIAHDKGKEILLHLPMEAMQKNELLGPGALRLDMSEKQFINTLDKSIRSVPYMKGINNHMGSLLTQHPGHMTWLMNELKKRGHFFVDSITSDHSIAALMAKESQVPHLRRDVFIDNVQDANYISGQFNRLIELSRKRGYAVGIGHPHPATVNYLSRAIIDLERNGVRLISLQEMLKQRNQGTATWQTSSSPSPRVVKN